MSVETGQAVFTEDELSEKAIAEEVCENWDYAKKMLTETRDVFDNLIRRMRVLEVAEGQESERLTLMRALATDRDDFLVSLKEVLFDLFEDE